MKKVVKITAYVLCLLAIAALTICYLVIPAKTKEVVDIAIGYLNTPVAIAGITTTIGGILIFVISKFIISNTKFGRKEIDTMKQEISIYKDFIKNYKGEAESKIADYQQKFEDMKAECENQIAVMYDVFEDLQANTMSSLKVIPNKKIQEIVETYEQNFSKNKEEIIEKTVNTNEYVNSKIKELEEKYQAFMKDAEGILNEREEEQDNQATEE